MLSCALLQEAAPYPPQTTIQKALKAAAADNSFRKAAITALLPGKRPTPEADRREARPPRLPGGCEGCGQGTEVNRGRKCRVCGQRGHDARNCPKKKAPATKRRARLRRVAAKPSPKAPAKRPPEAAW